MAPKKTSRYTSHMLHRRYLTVCFLGTLASVAGCEAGGDAESSAVFRTGPTIGSESPSNGAAGSSGGSTASSDETPDLAAAMATPDAGKAAAKDAGAAGTTVDAATSSSGCGGAGLVFCDDFEVGTTVGMSPPAPNWSLSRIGSGTVTIDDKVAAHSGKKSVHVSSAGGYQTFFRLTGAPVFPTAGALYLRVYIRLGAPMTGGHNTYYKAGAAGSSSSEHETRIGVMNSMLMINQPAGDRGFLSNKDYYNDGNKPGVVFASQAWTCVETFFDPSKSTIQIWVDGKDVPDLHRTDWQQDAIGAFHFGFEKYAGPDADIWYDDIAIGTQPIGCR